SQDMTPARILAIRDMTKSRREMSSLDHFRPRAQLSINVPDWEPDPPWLELSPLARTRAQGALLGLLCGAWVAASREPGNPDPDRYNPAWQPEVDRRAAQMGLRPADSAHKALRDSIRAALVAARTILTEGEYRRDAMVAAYRRSGVFIEPTEQSSNWFLPRLVPLVLFDVGMRRALPADVDLSHYLVSEFDAPADARDLPPEAAAMSEYVSMPFDFAEAEWKITHSLGHEPVAEITAILAGIRDLLCTDRADPLAGVRIHRSFDENHAPGFAWRGDRRCGHLYRDQVAPIFNAPQDELDPTVSEPRGPDDVDLPPLPRGVGLGRWGDEVGKRNGEVSIGDQTQPPLEETPFQALLHHRASIPPALPTPGDAGGDIDLSTTIEIIKYHMAHNLSLLSAVRETMRLGGNTIVPTAIVASCVGALHGRRAIPQTWIDAINTAEVTVTGISGYDLVEGHVAEALIQTGYRWGAQWLFEHGVNLDNLKRKPPKPQDEDVSWME
ncbi:MAG: hypothetical protein ACOCU4_07330, partial [Alkalispirochaeta sp.]